MRKDEEGNNGANPTKPTPEGTMRATNCQARGAQQKKNTPNVAHPGGSHTGASRKMKFEVNEGTNAKETGKRKAKSATKANPRREIRAGRGERQRSLGVSHRPNC